MSDSYTWPEFIVAYFIMCVTGIDYHGQNVDVYSTKSIDFTIGEWRVGDRVYNVGTDDSWTMKIKK